MQTNARMRHAARLITSLGALLAGAIPCVAGAAQMRVPSEPAGCQTNAANNFFCTLREAIEAANRTPEADLIVLSAGEYVLETADHFKEGDNALPAIVDALTIEGHGAVIRRSSKQGTPPFRLFRVEKSGDLTLKNVTLRNGATPLRFDGAAVWSVGALTIESSVLEDNHSGDDGGAIRSDGVLRITDSLIRGNSAAQRGGVGGALQNIDQFGPGRARIERTRFEGNSASTSGGALWLQGTVVMTNSTVSGNRAGDRGGAIMNYGSAELLNCTITDNEASNSGGLYAFGKVSMSNTVLSGNRVTAANGSGRNSIDCEGRVLSGGHNQIGSPAGCVIEGDATGNLIGPLGSLDPVRETAKGAAP